MEQHKRDLHYEGLKCSKEGMSSAKQEQGLWNKTQGIKKKKKLEILGMKNTVTEKIIPKKKNVFVDGS